MKRLLFFSAMSLLCLALSAQTKTWTGPSGGNFNNAANWNPSGIPGPSHDVIIPTGSNILIDGANIKSFALQGNATALMSNTIYFTAASSIAAGATIDCNFGYFDGSGTLTNNGTLNDNGISISNAVTIINNAAYNITTGGIHYIGQGSPLINNTATGTINITALSGSLQGSSGQGTIINAGTIKKTQSTELYGINIPLLNNNGTITVESGMLQIQNQLTEFNDGVYNVSAGSTLQWNSTFTCSGTLSGQLDGNFEWTGTMQVLPGTETTLDFNGPAGVKWLSGNFTGDGTLNNLGILNLESTAIKTIGGQSIFNNAGDFNINSTGELYIGYGTPTFTNTATGNININFDGAIQGASGNGNLINTGIIKKEGSTGNFSIASNITNTSPGKIMAETGLLQLYGSLTGNGILTGNGAVHLGSNIFGSTLSPGGHPGTLTHIGDYNSSPNAILACEIYGSTAGTQYDVLEIQGNANLEGDILLHLRYPANLNDEFEILTANSISSCNLPLTVTAHYGDQNYTFEVNCNPNNVSLKITDIVLGTDDITLRNISIYPNPNQGKFTLNLGKEYTNVSVQVYNMLGQIISTETFPSAKIIEKQIHASAGIYFVKISTAKEGSRTFRIIKQ